MSQPLGYGYIQNQAPLQQWAQQPQAQQPQAQQPQAQQQVTSEILKTHIIIFLRQIITSLKIYVKSNYIKYFDKRKTSIFSDEIKIELSKFAIYYLYLIILYSIINNYKFSELKNDKQVTFSTISKLYSECNIMEKKDFIKDYINKCFFAIFEKDLVAGDLDETKINELKNSLLEESKLEKLLYDVVWLSKYNYTDNILNGEGLSEEHKREIQLIG